MKKLIILITLTLFVFTGFSQTYYKIENDSIVKIGLPLSDSLSDGTYYYGNYRNLPDSVLYAEGWRWDVVVPEHDSIHQRLGERYFDPELDAITYQVDTIIYNVDELKANLKRDLSRAIDEFAVIITKAKLLYGDDNAELNAAIEEIRTMQRQTMQAINSFTTVDQLLNFRIRQEDIDYFKSLFEPFTL
nr:hypothetical protein [uncultured Draconibacterium sp.]